MVLAEGTMNTKFPTNFFQRIITQNAPVTREGEMMNSIETNQTTKIE